MSQEVSYSLHEYVKLSNLTLSDLESIRLILRGGSIIDWKRLNFKTAEEINRFLRTNGYDPTDKEDIRRLILLKNRALQYLEGTFKYEFPKNLRTMNDIHRLFLNASNWREYNRLQVFSCMVLKVMNIINHIDGRALLGYIDVTPNDLTNYVTDTIYSRLKKMQESGLPIVAYSGGEKSKSSMVTKLLSKQESIASQIFDRVRFRVITEKQEDVLPMLSYLKDEFIAVNYVIPGQSVNNLLNYIDTLKKNVRLKPHIKDLQTDIGIEDEIRIKDFQERRKLNVFSADTYHVINFVFDMPLRMTEFSPKFKDFRHDEFGNIIFSLIEIQVVDQMTDTKNQEGEASHERYKQRQIDRVWYRLVRGLKEI